MRTLQNVWRERATALRESAKRAPNKVNRMEKLAVADELDRCARELDAAEGANTDAFHDECANGFR